MKSKKQQSLEYAKTQLGTEQFANNKDAVKAIRQDFESGFDAADIPKDSIGKVSAICGLILSLTEKDFTAVEKMTSEQTSYVNPLKGATQSRLNDTGNYNKLVLIDIRKLHTLIKNKGN